VVEFIFTGKVHPDGFMGWEVSYSHPNENGTIDTGPRMPYAPLDNGAIEAFFREQLAIAEMEICGKILSRE
jgi:hypothetical protein